MKDMRSLTMKQKITLFVDYSLQLQISRHKQYDIGIDLIEIPRETAEYVIDALSYKFKLEIPDNFPTYEENLTKSSWGTECRLKLKGFTNDCYKWDYEDGIYKFDKHSLFN